MMGIFTKTRAVGASVKDLAMDININGSCQVEDCHKIWGISRLNGDMRVYADTSEYDDHYNRRRRRQTPTQPFLPKRHRFPKMPMAGKTDYQDAFINYSPWLYKPRESEQPPYKTAIILGQRHAPAGPVPYKYNPIGAILRGKNMPSLTYYQSDYLRIAPKVMKWCTDHKVQPGPDNLHVPKNEPMEKQSVNTTAYIRHPPWAYLTEVDKFVRTICRKKTIRPKTIRYKCASKVKEPKRSTYRPEPEKPKKKPLCKCAKEVREMYKEEMSQQQTADAGARTSPPPSSSQRSTVCAEDCKPVPAAAPTAARTPPFTEEEQALAKVATLRVQENMARRSSAESPLCSDSRSSRSVPPNATSRTASAAREAPLQKPAVMSPPQPCAPANLLSTTCANTPEKPASSASRRSPRVAQPLSPSPCGYKPPTRSEATTDLPLYIQGRPVSNESDMSIALATRVCYPYGPYGEYPMRSHRRPHRPTPEQALGTHVTRPPHGTGTAWYPMDLMINPKLGIFIGNAAH